MRRVITDLFLAGALPLRIPGKAPEYLLAGVQQVRHKPAVPRPVFPRHRGNRGGAFRIGKTRILHGHVQVGPIDFVGGIVARQFEVELHLPIDGAQREHGDHGRRNLRGVAEPLPERGLHRACHRCNAHWSHSAATRTALCRSALRVYSSMRRSISGRKCRSRPCTGQAAPSPNAQMVWPSICFVTSNSMSISRF